MHILLDDLPIEVVIIKKNNKNIYFRFKEDLKLYITCNRFVTKREIEKLIIKNKDALIKMYNRQIKENNANSYFNYLGKKYVIVYDENVDKIKFDEDFVYTKNFKMLSKFYQSEVLRVFNMEIDRCKSYFKGLPEFRLKVRNMKTRWGVCNRTDNIVTLNTELLKKDIDLIDYVIIHELCHFYEANHSKKFWDLVGIYYPEYKLAKKRLKEC